MTKFAPIIPIIRFMTKIISIAELVKVAEKSDTAQCCNGDYMLMHIVAGNAGSKSDMAVPAAIKIDGIAIFLCTGGEADVTINFRSEKISAGSVMVLSPNDLMEMIDRPQVKAEGCALFIPMEFAKSLSLDCNVLDYNNIPIDASPILHLGDDNRRLFEGYFNLLGLNAAINKGPAVYTRSISRSIVTAMIYQLMAFSNATVPVADANGADKASLAGGRRRYYVKDFMELLQHDFKKHRSVGYYADKLFISAKYLSLVIKEATGRTATEWIDHFVILEAKNLLRYSGRNIQQIAYDLNFHNQSAFGKYFKQLTGMSPSQFRKT